MSPQAQRALPFHQQVFEHYKQLILDGGLQPGDRLPSIRDIAGEWGVGQQAAQRGVELLKSAKLVRTSHQGTVVAEQRTAYGPQQRIRAARFSPGERAEVRLAELIPAPEYVTAILGSDMVIRREQLISDGAGPVMLLVTWVPPAWAQDVPELLEPAPLPDPRGAAHMIAGRSGFEVEWGRVSIESRAPMEDGREVPLLQLEPGEYVQAVVWRWGYGGGEDEVLLAYEEAAVAPNRVLEFDMEP